uniref:CUB domain-containing protein n=1 Tax=Caenorhabditis tropicalis TaxID=1561998 RepID=A0A1I7TIA0_9PELO
MTDCVWDDTQKVEFDNFAPGHPDASIGLCVSHSIVTSKWYSTLCTDSLPAAHEMPVIYGAAYGCESTLGDYCYTRIGDALPFAQAEAHCNHLCGHLASIHSVEENQWIRTLFSLYNNHTYTLGGYATSKKNLMWIDGTPMDFVNIQNFYEPGCLYMSYSLLSTTRGNWFSANCTFPSSFMCKRHLGVSCVPPTRPTFPPAPTLSSTCNSAPLQEKGIFASPNYPDPYPPYTNCTWTLVTYGPQRIQVKIQNTSVGDDWIYIYDGDSEKAQSLGNITGSGLFAEYSNQNVVFVTFRTGANQFKYKGFTGSFMTIY